MSAHAQATVRGPNATARWFVTYQYPGLLAGMSFAFNDCNLVRALRC